MNQLLVEAETYIKRSLPALDNLSKKFYSNSMDGTWADFSEMLEGLEWLMIVLGSEGFVDLLNKDESIYKPFLDQIKNQIKLLGDALDHKDFILVGDIIQFEVTETFQSLYNQLESTIKLEVAKHDIS